MNERQLRRKVIRLAKEKPDLRPVLLPLVREAGHLPSVKRAATSMSKVVHVSLRGIEMLSGGNHFNLWGTMKVTPTLSYEFSLQLTQWPNGKFSIPEVWRPRRLDETGKALLRAVLFDKRNRPQLEAAVKQAMGKGGFQHLAHKKSAW